MEDKELIKKYWDWCLWDWHTSSDFILTWNTVDWLPTLYQQDDIRFEYNQYNQKWSKASCTIFWSLGAISDLWNYKFELDEMKEINDLSYGLWRKEWDWWYIKDAVDLCCKEWNKRHPDKKVLYYYVPFYDDETMQKVLDKNYTIVCWFNWTMEYVVDYTEDNVLNTTWKGKRIFWHCVDMINYKGKKSIKDSDYGKKYNIYEIKPTNMALFSDWVYFPSAYVIVKANDDIEEQKRLEKIKTIAMNALNANSELRHNTNSEVVKEALHNCNEVIRDTTIKYINENLKQ